MSFMSASKVIRIFSFEFCACEVFWWCVCMIVSCTF